MKNTNWAYKAVNAMSQKGIVKGYADGTFKPNNTVTYAEFMKMALIAATGEDVGNAEAFNEETGAKQHWALNYYNKALELGYFGQTDINTYQLGFEIPRSDMALIVSNILSDVKIDNYPDLEAKLSDVDSKTENAYDIIKAYASGIITGYHDGTFKPEGTLTRAESSTVIYRLTDEEQRVLPTDEQEVVEEMATEPKEEKVIVSYAGNDNYTRELVLVKANLGDYGISKFEVLSNGNVAIFSTVRYDVLSLVIDNKELAGLANANGTDYWEENGYYIYVAQPKKHGIDIKGKVPAVLGIDKNYKNMIIFTDVTL